MALIVETGNGDNPDANSYASLDTIKAYFTSRGYTIPSDTILEQKAIATMDYIEAKRASYQGMKTWRGQTVDDVLYPVQPLQFPREGMQIDCVDFPSNVIPTELVKAQCAGTYEAIQADLMPNVVGGLPIIRKKVGPIEREYSDALVTLTGGIPAPIFPKVDALLDALINGCGGAFLSTVRV